MCLGGRVGVRGQLGRWLSLPAFIGGHCWSGSLPNQSEQVCPYEKIVWRHKSRGPCGNGAGLVEITELKARTHQRLLVAPDTYTSHTLPRASKRARSCPHSSSLPGVWAWTRMLGLPPLHPRVISSPFHWLVWLCLLILKTLCSRVWDTLRTAWYYFRVNVNMPF